MTLSDHKRGIAYRLREAGKESPDLDARLLVMAATGWSAAELILRGDDSLLPEVLTKIDALTARRLSGEPIDHILGYREFYGCEFKVTKDVLSPRPETEGLVEAALGAVSAIDKPRFLDLGTGSGAIIISCLREREEAQGLAVDISQSALKIAEQNAKRLGVDDRLRLLQGAWFDPVDGVFDVIVSNPPYITDAAMGRLSDEVLVYDPDRALRGGLDGLDPYRIIIPQALAFLNSGGALMLEIGYDQGRAVSVMMEKTGYEAVTLLKDLSGHDRIITGRKAAAK